MSGTSVDAIDCALARCGEPDCELVATHEHPIPPDTRAEIAALSQPGANEIDRMGALDRELGRLFAEATLALLSGSGTAPAEVAAIGSHGQTIRHRPASSEGAASAFTLQLGDPSTLAEHTGITVVADFRHRDIAAGGEGAPLAPAFHAAALAQEGVNRAIVNIGGIANVSLLQGTELHSGFDTGPGNTLLDHWIERQRGERYDAGGQWASSGQPHGGLLEALLAHEYFGKSGPRSTGKEAFNLGWLDARLAAFGSIPPENVQATLVELTSRTIASAIKASPFEVREVYVCGGGSHNNHLMQRLGEALAPARLDSTAVIGLEPDWVEAATFAWLASRTLRGLAGNAPAVTGASGPRVLGGVFSAR